MKSLQQEIEEAVNRHSADNTTGTPDYVLAKYLKSCLNAYATAVYERDQHAHVMLDDGRSATC